MPSKAVHFPIQSLDRLSESTLSIVGSVRTARRDWGLPKIDCQRCFGGLRPGSETSDLPQDDLYDQFRCS